MLYLTDYDLNIPEIPSDDECTTYIDQSDGQLKEAAKTKVKGYQLLKNISQEKATTERIGWLNLWIKTIKALDAAMLAYKHRNDFLLKIISRSVFEYLLHVMAILDSTENNAVSPEQWDEYGRKQAAVKRLRAYTAWCLWSDKVYYEESIDETNLQRVWDSNPAREVLGNESIRQFHETFFGPITLETDEGELQKCLQEHKERYKKKVDLIDYWLSDQSLRIWKEKIEKTKKKLRKKI